MNDLGCLHHSFSLKKADSVFNLCWVKRPNNVLIIHKLNDLSVLAGLKSVIFFLLKYFNICILLQESSLSELQRDENFAKIISAHLKPNFQFSNKNGISTTISSDHSRQLDESNFTNITTDGWAIESDFKNENSSLVVFDSTLAETSEFTDLVICLGGDGTILHVASIFQDSVPPVLSFYMGSLGFLTTFNFEFFPGILSQLLTDGGPCILRARLCCRVLRGSAESGSDDSVHQNSSTSYHVLNEATFSRGNCPYLSNLILKVNGKQVTSIQGDGLVVSTPTGSTAYSMSAGASIVNPLVPALVITPINPHCLSCRSLVLPMNARIEVSIDPEARANCMYLSNDGRLRHRHVIRKGDRVIITTSHYPVPCFCNENEVADWFCDLAQCLNWNVRHRQNQFNEARFLPGRFKEYSSLNSS